MIGALKQRIRQGVCEALGLASESDVPLSHTPPDQWGDLTVTLFAAAKKLGKNPQQLADVVAPALLQAIPQLAEWRLVKGFLNLRLSDAFCLEWLTTPLQIEKDPRPETIILEYPSPNTNKPLHLGHLRNIFLGQSLERILEARGHTVIPVCLFNDRGVHICRSMWAWKEFGNGLTPEKAGVKGDHFVGDYYVMYAKILKEEVDRLVAEGLDPEEAEQKARASLEVLKMLELWESGDPEVRALWQRMNNWVYEGFEATFRRLGVSFRKYYYESEIFPQIRQIVEEGLQRGVFERYADGSVHVNLDSAGLGDKVILRSNGTALYITQDIALAIQKAKDFSFDRSVYVVGNEQDHHFRVLFEILRRLEVQGHEKLYHLSYGMVELPSGRMKSREGTVVDADPLLDEMKEAARKAAQEAVKSLDIPEDEADSLYEAVGQAALRYHILRVEPRKKIVFNPEESIALQGDTGPFIQYTHARIRKLMRDGQQDMEELKKVGCALPEEAERALIKQLLRLDYTLEEAARTYNPADLAHFTYATAAAFSSYYQEVPILREKQPEVRRMRLLLADRVGQILALGLRLLGIVPPERM